VFNNPTRVLDTNNGADASDDEDEELEFRLFAPTTAQKSQHAPPQRIRVNSPKRSGKVGFVVAGRPPEYYFAREVDEERKARLEEAAVSGEDVMERANMTWKGCEMPWRVTKISAKGLKKEGLEGHKAVVVEPVERKRKRDGKKKRIAKRKKAKADELERQAAAEKETADKKKKAMINKKKQLKKRAREKALRTGGADTDELAHTEVDSGKES
jgi:hypothetical protein